MQQTLTLARTRDFRLVNLLCYCKLEKQIVTPWLHRSKDFVTHNRSHWLAAIASISSVEIPYRNRSYVLTGFLADAYTQLGLRSAA